jgi:hypothetical protein
LSQRLQRLELPQLELCDGAFIDLCGLLPALHFVEVSSLGLLDNHTNAACNWQEMVIGDVVFVDQLARLPLARAGRQGGVQKLSLTRITCAEVTPSLCSSISAVCGSECRLDTIPDSYGSRMLMLKCCGAACTQAVVPLLRCFEPDSVDKLALIEVKDKEDIEGMRVQAINAFAAEMVAGLAGLQSCFGVAFVDAGRHWYTPAACPTILPAMMPSHVRSIWLHTFHPDAVAAVFSPEALASVTRPISIRVGSDVDVAAVQAAVNAAGKGRLVDLECVR